MVLNTEVVSVNANTFRSAFMPVISYHKGEPGFNIKLANAGEWPWKPNGSHRKISFEHLAWFEVYPTIIRDCAVSVSVGY